MFRFLSLMLLSVVGVALAGCGEPEERLYPVKGRITVDGQPLHRGDIWFDPDETKGTLHLHYSLAKIQPDGSFELRTFIRPGAPLGWYKVVIFATKTEPPASPYGWKPDWIIDSKYATAATTTLTAQVVESPAAGAYDFQVTK